MNGHLYGRIGTNLKPKGFDPVRSLPKLSPYQLGSVSGKDLGHDSWLKYSSDAPVIELVARLRGRGKTTDVDAHPSGKVNASYSISAMLAICRTIVPVVFSSRLARLYAEAECVTRLVGRAYLSTKEC
jgi:hypothetical protein